MADCKITVSAGTLLRQIRVIKFKAMVLKIFGYKNFDISIDKLEIIKTRSGLQFAGKIKLKYSR